MKILIVSIALLALTLCAVAETGVSLTVYNQNLALVRDTRKMEFKKGQGEVLFRDVSAQIDATSVHFKAAGVDMLEQNFDYDLVAPEKLLQKYVNKPIEVVSKTGTVTRGTLLTAQSQPSNQIVLRQEDGTLKTILLSDNIAEIHYPTLPEGLITKPTLRWLVNSDASSEKETEVSYLTGGLEWHADYVMLLNDANTKADLDAWVTLDNTSGASYENAKLKLMAGEVHRAQVPQPKFAGMRMDMANAAPQFTEEGFFEYHLYTLQRPTTILNNQTKQVSLFPSTTAGISKVFTYDWQQNKDRVGVSAELANSEANGLGMALPAGRVRVYQKSADGSQEFIGEDNIEHTPKNEKVTVQIGTAFDIAAEHNQLNYRRISDRVSETDYEVKLRNHKKEAVEIVVVDRIQGNWEIIHSSQDYKKVSATKVEFRVTAEPEHEVSITYTVRTS
jgi:hypothetical protein